MKYYRKMKLLMFVISFFPFTLFADQIENYKIDPNHTYVLWHISHVGFSIQVGKFTNVDGMLIVDEAKPQNSKVDVMIPTTDLVTGIPKLDEHLKSDEFFDVNKYPSATFVSNKVDITGQNTGKIYGILTLHGVSKPVVLNVTLLKQGIHPLNNKKSLGFTATTTIKRSDFNMKTGLPLVGDEVKIDIGMEASLAS